MRRTVLRTISDLFQRTSDIKSRAMTSNRYVAPTSRSLRLEQLEVRLALSVQAAFAEVSSSIGLGGLLGGSGEFHAGGLTFTDLNNDGYADLYLIGPSSRGNRLYVNVDDGSGGRTFTRVVAMAVRPTRLAIPRVRWRPTMTTTATWISI